MTEANAADPDVVSKSEFARLTNVKPPRVTQWIEEKKIHGDALVGEGRSARIRVSLACQQLKRTLDIAQRLGNGIGTRLDLQPPASPDPAAVGAPQLPLQQSAPVSRPPVDPIEDQLRREKLEEYQRKNRVAAKQEAESDGRLTDADLAQQAMGRIAAQMVGIFEGALGDIAEAVAARYDLAKRDVMHVMRASFRNVRAAAAAEMRRQGEALPNMVEIDLGADAADTAAEAADAAES